MCRLYMKTYHCGYECCQSREGFDTWKHIQQHYKYYHKVTIKKKDPWDASIPRIIEVYKTDSDSEEDTDGTSKERSKRKRSARTAEAFKAQK